jgi:hypothetical protein
MVMPVPSTVAPTDMLLLRSSSHDYGYSQYNQRARVEGQIARWKQVIGDGLRFHSDEATEVAIAAQVLNRMLDLGSPNSVRVA